jgi:hypothetical protein
MASNLYITTGSLDSPKNVMFRLQGNGSGGDPAVNWVRVLPQNQVQYTAVVKNANPIVNPSTNEARVLHITDIPTQNTFIKVDTRLTDIYYNGNLVSDGGTTGRSGSIEIINLLIASGAI